jgi:FKBP-type peptidyl-prolyl cis-trans isomerase
MKKTFCVFLVFAGIAAFCFAEGIAEQSKNAKEKADMSYAFGMFVASDLKDTGLEFNYGEFARGFREIMESGKTRFNMDEAEEIIQAVFDRLRDQDDENSKLEAEKNLALGNAFLAENSKRPSVIVTPSGLQFELLSEGDGESPGIGDMVRVHYRGTNTDGIEFDSTYKEGQPLEFSMDGVIPGWSEGLRMMREGSRARLYIPPDLAYRERGIPGVIAPNAVIVFEVELLGIVRRESGSSD